MRTLKAPIEVRGYAMFDKFKLRGLLAYDPDGKQLRVSYSYGHLDTTKTEFVPSPFKEHSGVLTLKGEEFDAVCGRVGSKEAGTPWDILSARLYKFIGEKYGWFLERF